MKLRQISKIKFSGLRTVIGDSGGVIFDCDEDVSWLCRVVRTDEGLKWQIIKNKYQFDHCLLEHDQLCLDQYAIDEVEIIKEPMIKYIMVKHTGRSLREDFRPF